MKKHHASIFVLLLTSLLLIAFQPLSLYAHTSTGSHQHPHPPDNPNDDEGGPNNDEGGPNTDDVNPNTDDDDGSPNTDDDTVTREEVDDLSRRLQQIEDDKKKDGIVDGIKKVVNKVPVVGDTLEDIVDGVSKIIPTAVCSNCSARWLPRSDTHKITCYNIGHAEPVEIWLCYTSDMTCPKRSEHHSCSGQASHGHSSY